jgi:hypothetical protein
MSSKLQVSDMDDDLIFVSDSQDVQAIKSELGKQAKRFDSFFVAIGEGEYLTVYGMQGTVPISDKPVIRLV